MPGLPPARRSTWAVVVKNPAATPRAKRLPGDYAGYFGLAEADEGPTTD